LRIAKADRAVWQFLLDYLSVATAWQSDKSRQEAALQAV
jgi:hypothetical protein